MTSLFLNSQMPETWLIISLLFGAFLLSWLLTAAMRFLAPWLGLVDQPSGRKFHQKVTPRLIIAGQVLEKTIRKAGPEQRIDRRIVVQRGVVDAASDEVMRMISRGRATSATSDKSGPAA